MEELSGEIGIVVSGVGKMPKTGSVDGKGKDNSTKL